MASIINSTTTAGVTVTGDNSGSLQLATNNGTTAVTIDTSQNVGIGRTPDQRFQIAAPSAVQSDMFVGSTRTLTFYADATQTIVAAPTAIPMAFRTNDTERMRITSGGILVTGGATSEGGIDVGNAVNPGVAIYGTTSAKGIITVQNNTDSNMYMSKASGYSSGIYVKFYVNSSQVGKIETNGSTTSYVTTSDYRLKEDIAPLSGALDTVALLKPVTYKWKTTGDVGQGFIAHELQSVVPEAVSGAKDAVETYTDEDGNEQTRIKPQGIDTSFLVATLTAAIQEQQAQIEELKAEVQALKGTL